MTATAVPAPRQSALTVLRDPNFRLYFFSQIVSISGTWMQSVAQGWLVFHLTRSELWLGLVAFITGVPSLLFSPIAGVLVDQLPRRRLILWTQIAQMVLAFVLAALVFTDSVQVWHITVLAFLLGCTNAMDAPARQTFISDMVGHDQLTNGIRLNSIMIQTARVIGPTIAGVVLTQVGAAWCFLINGVSFLFVILALLYINVNGVVREPSKGHLLRGLLEGVRFVRGHPTIAPLLVFALVASVTLVNIIPLLPSYADLVLKSPKEGYAALNVAFGAGAVAAGVLSGWLHARIGRGRVAAWGMVLSAVAMAALAFTDALPVALALAAAFGFLMILAFVTCNTLVQSEVPDAFRGRVMALYTLTFFGIAPLGALPVGMVANALGTPLAILLCAVVGGVGCAVIMLRAPRARALV